MTSRPRPTPRPPLLVRYPDGSLRPFLRGMVTHNLMQRGFSFDDAYALARSLRDQLADRKEISLQELRHLVVEEATRLGATSTGPNEPSRPQPLIVYSGDAQPFSRGLLAQSLRAVGFDPDRAYRRVLEIQRQLAEAGIVRLESHDLSRFVAETIERSDGADFAARYRLLRRLRQRDRPFILFIGGASGTGKSTIALELSPLLRIYRITATDTIRQVMRMVFSSSALPSLHRSSFETGAAESEPDANDPGSVTRAFEEQATQVMVGVRAVVERAIAENISVLVEGVHLLPPLVPFLDLEGSADQFAIILTTLDHEIHRSHLVSRDRLRRGPSKRYLERFAAIRVQQQLLLERAEASDIPSLDTSDREESIARASRLLIDLLEQRFPELSEPIAPPSSRQPTLLLAIDGGPDVPLAELGGRTPLHAAKTPHLDRLAREGRCGLADPIAPGVVPDTASGSLALLGQSPQAMKRGPIEALGAGLDLASVDIALRGNFATLDENGFLIDRRAGRVREENRDLVAALQSIEAQLDDGSVVRFSVAAATEHRLAIVMHGQELSSAIVGSDPGDGAGPRLTPRPRPGNDDDEAARRTADALSQFELQARKILAAHPLNQRRLELGQHPANCVITRGAGHIHSLQPVLVGTVSPRIICITADRTVGGIVRALGGRVISSAGMTANLDTDLREKFLLAKKALDQADLVVLHVKGADIAAHEKRGDLKVEFLERVDSELGAFLVGFEPTFRLAVASDHSTSSQSGTHLADPVPVLIWGAGIEPDAVETFHEESVARGALARFPLRSLVGLLFSKSDR